MCQGESFAGKLSVISKEGIRAGPPGGDPRFPLLSRG